MSQDSELLREGNYSLEEARGSGGKSVIENPEYYVRTRPSNKYTDYTRNPTDVRSNSELKNHVKYEKNKANFFEVAPPSTR